MKNNGQNEFVKAENKQEFIHLIERFKKNEINSQVYRIKAGIEKLVPHSLLRSILLISFRLERTRNFGLRL